MGKHSYHCIACGELQKYSGNTFYSLPKTPTSFSCWMKLIGVDGSAVNTLSRVCSKHFEGGAKSKTNDVPTLCLNKSESEIRQIVADYTREIILRSQRPLESVINDANIIMENEDLAAQEQNHVGDIGGSYMYWKRFVTSEFNRGLDKHLAQMAENALCPQEIASTSADQSAASAANHSHVTATNLNRSVENVIDESASNLIERVQIGPISTVAKRKTASPMAAVSPIVKRLNQQSTPQPQAFIYKIDSSTQTEDVDRRVRKPLLHVDTLTEEQFRDFLGIERRVFDAIYKAAAAMAKTAVYWRGPKKTKSGNVAYEIQLNVDTAVDIDFQESTKRASKTDEDLRAEMFLTLMKLRSNVSYSLLEYLFGWSTGKVSSVFHTWLDILERILRHVILFPNQVTCWSLIPPRVATKFPRLRCMIDCTEIAIEKPQQTYLQAITYSQYKKNNTIKVLVAVLANGCIAYISKVWAGRASDKFIMQHDGLMNLLERGDTVLADKGFSITHELLVRGVALNAPPGSTGRVQFTSEEVRRGMEIANVRVHVERAIGRMKNYKILQDKMPIAYVPIADKIVRVIGALCNFHGPLIGK